MKKVNKSRLLGEIQLLTGAVPSILFPLLGFVGACIQVRYKNEYNENCLGLEDVA